MYSFKLPLFILTLCLNFSAIAQTDVEITIPQRITELQQVIDNVQTDLENAQTTVLEKEKSLPGFIETLKTMSKINVQILEEAEQAKAEASTEVAKWQQERQAVEADLEKQRNLLTEMEETLTTPTTTPVMPSQEMTDNQPVTTTVENHLVLQKRLVEMTETYLDLVKKRVDMAEKQLKIATERNDKLQNVFWTKPSEEKQKLVQESQEVLKRKRETLQVAQKELPGQIASLETMPTAEMAEALKKATIDEDAANVDVENLRLEQQSREGSLARLRDNLKELQDGLESLKKYVVDPKVADKVAVQKRQVTELENKVGLQKKLVALEEQYLEIIQKRMEVARQYLSLVGSWQAALQNVSTGRKKQDLESDIQSKTAPYQTRAVEFRKALEGVQDHAQRSLLEAQIQEADSTVQKIVYELKLENLNEQFERLTDAIEQTNKIPSEKFANIQAILNEFSELHLLLKNKIDVLKQQQEIVKRRGESLPGNEFIAQAKELLETTIADLNTLLPTGQTALEKVEKAYTEYQRRLLLNRRELPKDFAEWQTLWKEVAATPGLFLQQLQFAWLDLRSVVGEIDSQLWLLISVTSLIWLGLVIWVQTKLTLVYEKLSQIMVRSFVANSMLTSLRLLHRNAVLLAMTGIIVLFLWVAPPNPSTLWLLIIVGVTGLGVKLLVNLAWLLFSEREVRVGKRSKVYQQLRGTFMFMGLLTMITAVCHVPYEKYDLNTPVRIRELFDSFFMLFLSLTVWPVMRIRNLMLTFLEDSIKGYWLLVIRLITLLLPLSILAVAALGVIGYLNLGWKVAEHASLFLLVLTGWLIAQGLLDDSIILLKNLALRHSQYGLLWTQDIIPLLHKLLMLTLVGLSLVTFWWLTGWYTDAAMRDVAIKESIERFFSYPLFTVGNTAFNMGNLLLSILTLWAVFWFGGWCRQVTYRWIYVGVVDLGMRHSLSVFTQYAVILIGLFITLRMMGIDLTTLTVFAGALGVGIGFGLQNIANNFISGILLLIERPLRRGDVVNIGGNYEGMVTEIGIRSLTLQTRDLDEVIIPNADLISNAFKNLTHSNSIKRFTVYVGVSYENDPNEAREVIKNAVANVPAVVKEPHFRVNLWEFADSAITFRIDYFINLQEASIDDSRGAVLLNVWNHLKQANIKIPYPQREVYVKWLPTAESE